MKYLLSLVLIYFCTAAPTPLSTEDFKTCKVTLPAIADSYEGECKKGLAHGVGKAVGEDVYEGEFRKGVPYGEGKYVWKEGSFYVGEWRRGLRHGKGTMYTSNEDGSEIVKGKLSRWKNDVNTGPIFESNYKVVRKYNIHSLDAKLLDDTRNYIKIYFRGSPQVEDLNVLVQSGRVVVSSTSVEVFDTDFPQTVVLNFTGSNQFNTVKYNCIAEIKLESAGNWEVTLNQ